LFFFAFSAYFSVLRVEMALTAENAENAENAEIRRASPR
jgi:hypothetical protein